MKFEILTEENFMGRGTESYLSDFAIICGVKPYHGLSKRGIRRIYGSYFLDNPLNTKDFYGRYKVVNYKGYISREYNLGNAYGIKPMINFNDVKEKATNFKMKDGYISFEFGSYPQKIVGDANKFIASLDQSKLIRNDKEHYYYSELEEDFLPLYEYECQGKRYVFLKANLKVRKSIVTYEDGVPFEYPICKGNEILSDGNVYNNYEDVAFEVTPIKWILNGKTKKAFTKSILIGNMPIENIDKFLNFNFVI